MRDVVPLVCSIEGCGRMGEALVQRYEPEDESPYGLNLPTGEWVWLCDEHTRQEFA